MTANKAVILVNIGSPESLKLKDIRKYLKAFLGDGRVIEMPFLLRKLLVNGIIVPFRASKSKKLYEKLWTDEGSPLIVHSDKLTDELQQRLEGSHDVFTAMRYSQPHLKDVLENCLAKNYAKIIVVPMFPQYASSTTGSVIDYCMQIIKNKQDIPDVRFISNFYDNQLFIDAFVEKIKKHEPENYDFVLFSYHGLPLKAVYKSHYSKPCDEFACAKEVNRQNQFCYQATCYETTKLLAQKLNLSQAKYTVCFQSRFAKKWLSPFTDEVLIEKAKKGIKKILVVSPAFVADCLETIVEIGDEYSELFRENGGEKLQLVESLNDSDKWVEALVDIVTNS